MRAWGLLALLGVVGCGTSTRSIKGDWVLDELQGATLMTFNDNGTYTSKFAIKGVDVIQSGTYVQTGTWLHIQPERIQTKDEALQHIYDRERLSRMVMRTKWLADDVVRLSMEHTRTTQTMHRPGAKTGVGVGYN